MSHVTDVKLKVTDLDALERAAERLGFEFRRDQKTYAWYGRFMNDSNAYGKHDPKNFGKSEHALRLKNHQPGDYEVGVVKSLDGDGYEILFDEWGPGQKLKAVVGPQANALRREYAAEVAEQKAMQKLSRHGWRVQREDLPGNRIRLRLKKR